MRVNINSKGYSDFVDEISVGKNEKLILKYVDDDGIIDIWLESYNLADIEKENHSKQGEMSLFRYDESSGNDMQNKMVLIDDLISGLKLVKKIWLNG